MVLTAGELSQARAEMNATLPATCAIHRATRTANDSGGWADVFASVGSVACRVSYQTARESLIAGRIAAETTHVIRVPALTDIRAGDQVVEFSDVYEIGPPLTRSEELIRGVLATRIT